MEGKNQKGRRLTAAIAVLLAAAASLSARETVSGQTDSLVRLLNAKYIEQVEKDGDMIRKAVAATFLHNGTYLISDSALWSTNNKVINYMGNVRMIQGDTELTSEKLDYYIDDNLAQFRGTLVQLRNKQDNILRTRILDYNTKDSIAVFSGGASMRSSNGQIIESDDGSYYNSSGLFTFGGDVNMYTDSVFVRTTALEYDSEIEKAYFTAYIDFWKDSNMLSADGGWYDRGADMFFFTGKVHGLSEAQESWSDSLYFNRMSGDVLMLGNAQVQDTTRNVAALSDYLFYQDSLAKVTMRRQAAVALWSETEGKIDTTYMGADTLIYHTMRKCDIPEGEISVAASRLEAINGDPVREFRRRAAEEAAKKKAEQQAQEGQLSKPGQKAPSQAISRSDTQEQSSIKPPEPASVEVKDTLSAAVDSLVVAADTLVVPDTTRIGFILGTGNVKIFREDMQVRCDSVQFCELDSIARFYKDPVIWNEGRRQYSADSLFVLVKDNGVDRANLMSDAFIAIQEDSTHFDQIKSSEVMAYFDSDAELRRFDALGGVTALFYLKEEDIISTVNKVEAKMLSASMKDGELQRVYYFDNPKNDAYPVVQLPAKDSKLKGFNWRPELRPASRTDISDIEVRRSERSYYESRPHAAFTQTERFFPGYMDDVYKAIEEARMRSRSGRAGNSAGPADSLSVPHVKDSLILSTDSLALADTLSRTDSLALSSVKDTSDVEDYMSERELKRALRIARRDARWAELDARDAEKAAVKAAKAEERRRRKEEKAAKRQARLDAREAKVLNRYVEYYERQRNKNERKQESEPARERESGAEAGGELQAASGDE